HGGAGGAGLRADGAALPRGSGHAARRLERAAGAPAGADQPGAGVPRGVHGAGAGGADARPAGGTDDAAVSPCSSRTQPTRGRLMTWRHRQVIGVLAAGALLAGCAGGESRTPEAAGEGGAAVTLAAADVAVAERESVAAGVVVTGTLLPYREVEVRAQVPGVLASLQVDRGDAVREGQVLGRIEAEGIRGQAASAQAGVAAAEAGLALAARQLESARKLYEAGAMSEIEFRQAQAAHEAAQAQLEAARAQAVGAGE